MKASTVKLRVDVRRNDGERSSNQNRQFLISTHHTHTHTHTHTPLSENHFNLDFEQLPAVTYSRTLGIAY